MTDLVDELRKIADSIAFGPDDEAGMPEYETMTFGSSIALLRAIAVLSALESWVAEDDEDLIRMAAASSYDSIDYDMEVEAYQLAQKHVRKILAGERPPGEDL